MAYAVTHHVDDGGGAAPAQTITSTSFTPETDAYIFVAAAGANNNHTTVPTWTISDTEGLNWTQVGTSSPGAPGTFRLDAVLWRTTTKVSSPASMTVTIDKFSTTDTWFQRLVVHSVTGLDASTPTTNFADGRASGDTATITRTAPTGPTLAWWFVLGEAVAVTFGAPDTNYTRVQQDASAGQAHPYDSWESADSTATSINQNWSSSGAENVTIGISIELIEETGPVTGTATLTYGGTVTATGTPTRLGTATGTYGGAVTATGTSVPQGTATLAYGGTVTATGTIPTTQITGTAALTYGGTTVGTGTTARHGTATAAYGGTTAANGQTVKLGAATADYGGTLTATGTIPTDNVTGTATLNYSGDVAGTGTVNHHGTATADYGGTLTASGVIPTGAVLGTATLDYSGATTATGTTTKNGTGTADYGGTTTIDAEAIRQGTATLDYSGTLTATGTVSNTTIPGTAQLDYGGTTSGTGTTTRLGTAALTYGGTLHINVDPLVVLHITHLARLNPPRHTARTTTQRHTARIGT